MIERIKEEDNRNMEKSWYIIKVLDKSGNWYDNAKIENSYDAVMVGKFYRDTLGYWVQLWHKDRDLTSLLDSSQIVTVSREL